MINTLSWILLSLFIADSSIDFDTQVVPVLTKSGCNAGACHGAAAGRGGFHLSLLGGDAKIDYESIVEQYEGRRVHLLVPEKSLVIKKPTMQLDHEGGEALTSDGIEIIRQWIAQGASRKKSRSLHELRVQPESALVNSIGSEIPLQVIAKFSDGATENVTRWTVFVSSDPASLSINDRPNNQGTSHTATLHRRGQHTLIARFLDRVVPIRITVPLSDNKVLHSGEARNNFIDEYVFQTLDALRLTISKPADDGTFLRRVTLDLTGRLPRADEIAKFVASSDPNKRVQLVNELIDSDAFIDYWTYRFAKLLRVLPQPNDTLGANVYHSWIRTQIAQRSPIDHIARELLISTGDTHQIGPANFSRSSADARSQAELVSQIFMGTRLQCANCHNHPLDRWTQDDYHGLAAIFAKLERNRVVKLSERGAVTNLRTGDPAIPRVPGTRYLAETDDPRQEFSNWLVSPDNPFFAKSFVNRLWRGMFGRGLVEPADDLRDTNPATHPELLNALAKDFIEHHFDFRHTLKRIALSATYARSSTTDSTNEIDDRFYSHAVKRPLEPEVLADILCDATGVADTYGEERIGTRAISLVNVLVPSESLDILGRCSRRESCESAMASSALKTKLHLLNGDLINRKVTAKDGFLHAEFEANKDDHAILRNMYLRTLCRPPNDIEVRHWLAQLSSAGNGGRAELFEDIFWSILNCSEFLLNH